MYKNYKKTIYPNRHQKERPYNFRTHLLEDWSSEMVLHDDDWRSLWTFQANLLSLMFQIIRFKFGNFQAKASVPSEWYSCRYCVAVCYFRRSGLYYNFEILDQFNVLICPKTSLQWHKQRPHVSGMQWISKSRIIWKFGTCLTDNYAEIQYFCQTRQAVVHATHCKMSCPC